MVAVCYNLNTKEAEVGELLWFSLAWRLAEQAWELENHGSLVKP